MSSLFRSVSMTSTLLRQFSTTVTRSDLNKVQMIGRIGADPTVTEVGDSLRVVNYTVATSETRPDKEGNLIKKTQWHRITSWNSADWLPAKVKKGDLVYVEGQLRYGDYTDKEGVQRTKAEILQSQFRLLSLSRSHQNDQEAEE